MLYYHIDDDFSKVCDVNSDFNWLVINHLYEPVNNNEDWAIAVSLLIRQNWQTRDKIH